MSIGGPKAHAKLVRKVGPGAGMGVLYAIVTPTYLIQ